MLAQSECACDKMDVCQARKPGGTQDDEEKDLLIAPIHGEAVVTCRRRNLLIHTRHGH